MKIYISIIFLFFQAFLFGQFAGGPGKGDASASLPLLFCPNNMTLNTSANGAGDCFATASWTHPAVPEGLVNPINYVMSINEGTETGVMPGSVYSQQLSPGTYTIDYLILDAEGYDLTCSFEITVVDDEQPVLTCLPVLTMALNGQPGASLNISDFAITLSDNCGITMDMIAPTSVTSAQLGQTIPVTIVVQDAEGNTATCNSVLSLNDLPPGWSHSSGSVGDCDSEMRYATNTGIWSASAINCTNGSPFQSDKQLFAKRQLCGDGSITAQVTGLMGAPGFAGISMRESGQVGAKKVQMTINRVSNIVRREIRLTNNGQAFPMDFSSPCERSWLRITRTGNMFRGYTSMDGITWWYVMQVLVPMNSCIDIGLVLQNMQAASTAEATFANVSTTGGTPMDAIQTEGFTESLIGDISIYPNPSAGQISLEMREFAGQDLQLAILNSQGQLVWSKALPEAPDFIDNIDLKHLPAGIYQLMINDAKAMTKATQRIVIQ
jgi:hypothetical protein